jgi:hypothetical protein
LIRFDWIRSRSRNQGVLLDTYAEDEADLIATIEAYLRPLIPEPVMVPAKKRVSLDLAQGKGWIDGGRKGTFTIEEKST